MISPHVAGTPDQATTGDGVHRVSVLLYSDDITMRDAVRRGRRPASGARRRGRLVARVRDARGGRRGARRRWPRRRSSSTARRPPSAAWACATSSRTRSSTARRCSCSPGARRTAGSRPGRSPTGRPAPARPHRRVRGHRRPRPVAGRGRRLTRVSTPAPATPTWPDLLAALLRREDLAAEDAALGDDRGDVGRGRPRPARRLPRGAAGQGRDRPRRSAGSPTSCSSTRYGSRCRAGASTSSAPGATGSHREHLDDGLGRRRGRGAAGRQARQPGRVLQLGLRRRPRGARRRARPSPRRGWPRSADEAGITSASRRRSTPAFRHAGGHPQRASGWRRRSTSSGR